MKKLGQEPTDEAFLFSYAPLHDRPCSPDGVSHTEVLTVGRPIRVPSWL